MSRGFEVTLSKAGQNMLGLDYDADIGLRRPMVKSLVQILHAKLLGKSLRSTTSISCMQLAVARETDLYSQAFACEIL